MVYVICLKLAEWNGHLLSAYNKPYIDFGVEKKRSLSQPHSCRNTALNAFRILKTIQPEIPSSAKNSTHASSSWLVNYIYYTFQIDACPLEVM